MSKKPLFFLFCATIILGNLNSHSQAQTLSGSSLSISGTGTISTLVSDTASITSGSIGSLVVGGTTDILGNTLLLGSWALDPTRAGLSIQYYDGNNGDGANLTFLMSRSSAVWNWQRMTASGSTATVMQLDPSNRLILTGTDPNNIQQLILDPNGSADPGDVLTLQAADSRYVSNANICSGEDSWGYGSPAIGIEGGNATAPFSFAGIGAHASEYGAVASGYQSNASGYQSNAIANQANASGLFSNAVGTWSTASGASSTALGYAAVASGDYSTASGAWSRASGGWSTALAPWAVASGDYSTACGDWSTASGWGSLSGGFMTIAQGCFQTVLGTYNIPQGNPQNWNPADPLFIIGNGTPPCDPLTGNPLYDQNGVQLQGVQSNALVINKNGDTTIYGALTIGGTSSSVNSIANGGLVVTGTAVQVVTETGTGTKIVASGSNQLVLIPEQGDLSMGSFTHGAQPVSAVPSQTFQQSAQNSISSQNIAGIKQGTSQTRAGQALASGSSASSGTSSMTSGTVSAQ